jgi:hypothetical protein
VFSLYGESGLLSLGFCSVPPANLGDFQANPAQFVMESQRSHSGRHYHAHETHDAFFTIGLLAWPVPQGLQKRLTYILAPQYQNFKRSGLRTWPRFPSGSSADACGLHRPLMDDSHTRSPCKPSFCFNLHLTSKTCFYFV